MRAWLLRLAVSGAILATLLAFVPISQLWSAMRDVPPALWAGAVGCFLAGHVVSAWKWRLLMTSSAPPPSVWLRAHFAGLMANLCLPGIAGGDVVRAAWVMRRVESKEDVAIASLADRAIDCASLLMLAAVGAVWAGRMEGAARHALLTASLFGVAAVLGGAVGYAILRRRPRAGVVGRIMSAFERLLLRPLRPAAALGLSLVVQALFIVVNVWLGRAAGIDVPVAVWLFAWPLAKLVALVPISLAGLGVREAALVALMRPFGANPPAVMASGLLWQGVLITSGLAGWLASHTLSRKL